METLTVVKEIAIILLLVGAFGLCVVVAWGLVKLFPHLRRWAEYMAATAEAASKISGDFAAVSADVAGDVQKTVASTAVGAEHLASTAEAASKIGGDFAAVSADVAGDVRKAAASTADGAKDFAQTSRNLMESSGSLRTALQVVNLLVAAGGGVANIAQKGISQMPAQLRNVFSRVRPNS